MRKQSPLNSTTVRQLLKESNITQASIAKELGVTRAMVCLVLDGRSYSQRVWDKVLEKINQAKKVA